MQYELANEILSARLSKGERKVWNTKLHNLNDSFVLQRKYYGDTGRGKSLSEMKNDALALYGELVCATYRTGLGRPYFVTRDLCGAFEDTEFNYPINHIKFPFRSFEIVLEEPICFAPSKPVHNIMVYNEIHDGKLCIIMSVMHKNTETLDSNVYVARYNFDMEVSFEKNCDNLSSESDLGYDNASLLQFVFNTVTYISSPDADSKYVTPIMATGRRSKPSDYKIKQPHYIMGQSFKYIGNSDPSYKIGHRYCVAGHWRKQPYGPRTNSKYRPIWIKPFLKGPETAELIRSVGIVK